MNTSKTYYFNFDFFEKDIENYKIGVNTSKTYFYKKYFFYFWEILKKSSKLGYDNNYEILIALNSIPNWYLQWMLRIGWLICIIPTLFKRI